MWSATRWVRCRASWRAPACVRIANPTLLSLFPVGTGRAVLAFGRAGNVLSRQPDPRPARNRHWPLQTWGGVYPRTGWTTQAEEPKAAAINAQRAGDIATRTRQPHVYIPISGCASADQSVWPPGPLVEGDPATGEWQMLLPKAESSCAVFGTNDLASVSGWGGGRVDPEGDYAWTLWRPYSCCKKEGELFLFDINWINYPP